MKGVRANSWHNLRQNLTACFSHLNEAMMGIIRVATRLLQEMVDQVSCLEKNSTQHRTLSRDLV